MFPNVMTIVKNVFIFIFWIQSSLLTYQCYILYIIASLHKGSTLVHRVNNKKPSKRAELQPSILISSGQGKLENQSLCTHVRVVFQNKYEAAILLSRGGKKLPFWSFSSSNYTFN